MKVFINTLFLISLCGIQSCQGQEAANVERQLEVDVKKLSITFHPRSHQDLENLEATAAYIEEIFRKSGAEVRSQEFEAGGNTYRNVLARFGKGEGPLMVVGAHYDAHQGTPGADDNASGVAGLLEIARRLGEMENPPRVELAAYCLEEPPYFASEQMGSFQHAKSLKESQTKVKGMLSLEMIGTFSDKAGSQHYPLPAMEKIYPNKGNFIGVVSRLDQVAFTQEVKKGMQAGSDLPVESLNAPEALPGVDFSDHRNFWKFGYPAVMITDTAFMRNPYYHRAEDTADRLDYIRMAKVMDGVFHFLTITPAE